MIHAHSSALLTAFTTRCYGCPLRLMTVNYDHPVSKLSYFKRVHRFPYLLGAEELSSPGGGVAAVSKCVYPKRWFFCSHQLRRKASRVPVESLFEAARDGFHKAGWICLCLLFALTTCCDAMPSQERNLAQHLTPLVNGMESLETFKSVGFQECFSVTSTRLGDFGKSIVISEAVNFRW